MAVIAKEAGYTTPTLYSYFRGKLDIFNALRDSVTGEMEAIFEAHEPAGLSFRQRIELLLTRQLQLVDRRLDVFTFFLSTMMSGDGPPAAKKHGQYEERLHDWIRQAAADSPDGPESPDLVATMLHGLGHAFLTEWLTKPDRGAAVELAPLISRLLFHGCCSAEAP